MGLLGAGIGAVIGSALGSFWGGVLGAFAGSYIQNRFRERPREGASRPDDSLRHRTFLSSMSAMMAKLAKVDGHVSPDEIRAVEGVFDSLRLSADDRNFCIQAFRDAKDDSATLYEWATAFARNQPNVNVRIILYEVLWRLAAADGAIHPAELDALRQLPGHLRIPGFCFRMMYGQWCAGEPGGGSSYGGEAPRGRATPSLDDDYELLGVSPDASDADVKRAYREKAKKLHPDELAAQGLPPEMVQQANEQMAHVNEAYARIKKARGQNRRAGFTLLELLAVLGILSVLLGIVLSAVHSVQAHSRRSLARAEVRSVEAAFKMYLDHYGSWKRLLDNLPEEDRFQKGAVECFAIGEALGYALEGDSYVMSNGNDVGTRANAINPDAVPFIEFSRHYRDTKNSSTDRFPVNPWGTGSMQAKAMRDGESQTLGSLHDARYIVALDANCNGSITLPGNARFPEMGNGRLSRAVVVWTYNPQNETEDAIVSWME